MSDTPTSDFDGLTESELATLLADSEQRTDEDATNWAARARFEAESAKALAKSRREATPAASTEPTAQ